MGEMRSRGYVGGDPEASREYLAAGKSPPCLTFSRLDRTGQVAFGSHHAPKLASDATARRPFK
jgi:hypothetical protein